MGQGAGNRSRTANDIVLAAGRRGGAGRGDYEGRRSFVVGECRLSLGSMDGGLDGDAASGLIVFSYVRFAVKSKSMYVCSICMQRFVSSGVGVFSSSFSAVVYKACLDVSVGQTRTGWVSVFCAPITMRGGACVACPVRPRCPLRYGMEDVVI